MTPPERQDHPKPHDPPDLTVNPKEHTVRKTKTASGIDLIAAERQRQIDVEGYDAQHDAQHDEDLALAAMAYLTGDHSNWWPWSWENWKPSPDDRVRELVKAGALIAAEIDRLAAS